MNCLPCLKFNWLQNQFSSCSTFNSIPCACHGFLWVKGPQQKPVPLHFGCKPVQKLTGTPPRRAQRPSSSPWAMPLFWLKQLVRGPRHSGACSCLSPPRLRRHSRPGCWLLPWTGWSELPGAPLCKKYWNVSQPHISVVLM